jgi:hypothetical protein
VKQKTLETIGVELPKSRGRRGLALPIRAGSGGGFATSTGDNAGFERIATALGDDDNRNAFRQSQALGLAMVFDVADPGVRARIRAKLTAVFDGFEREKRYRLLPETIEWREGNGELELTFKYHDLESDEVKNFSKVYKG